jgi:hypothetical protein
MRLGRTSFWEYSTSFDSGQRFVKTSGGRQRAANLGPKREMRREDVLHVLCTRAYAPSCDVG